ncbi:hypothetical protein [Pseudomonas sp. MWU13-3659]|uniref:hypothetical protein n=1 Tax=Pseudomonas sp. MWU13-3659 TaxID=2986964 RepID=UPI0020760659|nr:hypothetical protein [Pseudomonas sp. MWU13-3659]
MKVSTATLNKQGTQTQAPEQSQAVPLDSTCGALAPSPCMPHRDLNYTQMLDAANKKPMHLLAQEQAAAEQLIAALNNNTGVSNRLSKLSNEQIRVFFPCVYVEAKHRLNPIVAYNTKDTGCGDIEHDDNVAMLQGYGDFLTAVQEAAEGKAEGRSSAARTERLLDRYLHLAGTLTNMNPGDVFKGAGANYSVPATTVFKHEDIYKHLNGNPFLNQIKTLSCGHRLGIVPIDENIMYCVTISDPEKKEAIIREVLTNYISAIDTRNIDSLLQVTSDYQFLHFLPNANGRSSQIMRDCALMHLGHFPLSSLTTNSHYLSPQQPVEHEHFLFMQKNTEEILSAIEQQNLTLSLCKKNTPHLAARLIADARTDAIKFDVGQFLGEDAAKYFAPSLLQGCPHSVV